MFRKKRKGHIVYKRMADAVAPPKKKSHKGRIALALGLIGVGAAFVASGTKGGDAQ